MFAKKSGRVSFRSNKRSNYRKNTNSYLSNKLNKPHVKGNITQLYDKYFKLGKEASSSGDKVQSEYYYQFADHFFRLMNELGLKSFHNENNAELDSEKILHNENKVNENNETNIINENNVELVSKKIPQNEDNKIESDEKKIIINNIEDSEEESSESIESVSFIAKPAKKKSTKSKKEIS